MAERSRSFQNRVRRVGRVDIPLKFLVNSTMHGCLFYFQSTSLQLLFSCQCDSGPSGSRIAGVLITSLRQESRAIRNTLTQNVLMT